MNDEKDEKPDKNKELDDNIEKESGSDDEDKLTDRAGEVPDPDENKVYIGIDSQQSEQDNSNEIDDVNINLTERDFRVFREEVVKNRGTFIKENTAKRIGLSLLIIFGATIGFILFIFMLFVFKGLCIEQVKEYTNSLINLLEGLSKFSSAVFTPLLAFVLGYYFGTTRQDSEKG